MGKIIAVANRKGGVGKTTSTHNIAVGLARLGKKVLMVDLDPQANLTLYAGITRSEKLEYTISNAFQFILNKREINNSKFIWGTKENIYIIPANENLATMEFNLTDVSHGIDSKQ